MKWNDPFATFLGIRVTSIGTLGITVTAALKHHFRNPYGIAHGGFLFGISQVAAQASAKEQFGILTQVVDVTSDYMVGARGEFVHAAAELLCNSGDILTYWVRVWDGNTLCSNQFVTLRARDKEKPRPEFRLSKTIFQATADTEMDPLTGIAYPDRSFLFAGACGIYAVGRSQNGLIYGFDVDEHNCDDRGTAHNTVLYTCADSVVGRTMVIMQEKKPVTVSSTIHFFREAEANPILAEAEVVRDGKRTSFYVAKIRDGNGNLLSVSEFVLQSVDFRVTHLSGKYLSRGYADR